MHSLVSSLCAFVSWLFNCGIQVQPSTTPNAWFCVAAATWPFTARSFKNCSTLVSPGVRSSISLNYQLSTINYLEAHDLAHLLQQLEFGVGHHGIEPDSPVVIGAPFPVDYLRS